MTSTDDRPVRFGIISTADIGVAKVVPAIQRAENCVVTVIGSRDRSRAEAAAGALDIPVAHDSYEAVLEDPEVDAVYIPLPNDMHAEWTIRAAEAGKHVLCEKPLAMSADQALEMVDACAEHGVLLQEAFMYRHHPTWVETVRLVRSGAIGGLQAITSAFSYYNDDPANIRNRLENGGGAVMDIGCYNINLSRMLFDAEPVAVASIVRRDPRLGVDIVTSAVLEFPDGGQSSFTCSTRAEPFQRVWIHGTMGRIEVEIPFNIPVDVPTRISVTVDDETETIVFPEVDQYTIQASLFAEAIRSGGPVAVDPSDAVANMTVIEAVLAGDAVEPAAM